MRGLKVVGLLVIAMALCGSISAEEIKENTFKIGQEVWVKGVIKEIKTEEIAQVGSGIEGESKTLVYTIVKDLDTDVVLESLLSKEEDIKAISEIE